MLKHWSPAMMFCRPWAVASWPDTATLPFSFWFFSAAITELAMPSLATMTALMSGVLRSMAVKVVPAAALSHLAMDWSSTFFQPDCLDSTPS